MSHHAPSGFDLDKLSDVHESYLKEQTLLGKQQFTAISRTLQEFEHELSTFYLDGLMGSVLISCALLKILQKEKSMFYCFIHERILVFKKCF